VANVTPGEFWPTRRETVTTGIMVAIMTSILAIFFFGVDAMFSAIVQFLLGLLAK
jgi:preprotein translocase subunit SecE